MTPKGIHRKSIGNQLEIHSLETHSLGIQRKSTRNPQGIHGKSTGERERRERGKRREKREKREERREKREDRDERREKTEKREETDQSLPRTFPPGPLSACLGPPSKNTENRRIGVT